MEIPGVHLIGLRVLPAGTYVFKLLDSHSDRHIVQILSADEKTVYATILAIPNYRLKATDKTVITFSERPAGQPEALRAWFYPGRNWGEEFVYPKAMAMELAKTQRPGAVHAGANSPLKSRADQSRDGARRRALVQAPIVAITPTGVEVELLKWSRLLRRGNRGGEPVAPSFRTTASSRAADCAVGLLALGGAFVVRLLRKSHRSGLLISESAYGVPFPGAPYGSHFVRRSATECATIVPLVPPAPAPADRKPG